MDISDSERGKDYYNDFYFMTNLLGQNIFLIL